MNNFDVELIKKYISIDKQEEALKKLKSGYPVQYIIGNVDFYGLTINVKENVLIPRFETEYLVDDILKLVKKYNFINPKIIELGSGTGCISIALKKNLDCEITAIDNNIDAVNLAKQNANNNSLNISFLLQDIHNLGNGDYDILVSNPPYVPYDGPTYNIEYEPKSAIFADDNGLYFYKIILEKSVKLLKERNIIAFEIGDGQGESVRDIALKYYPSADIILKKDLNNRDRYVYIINT